jgi:hypothetical protein
VRTPIFSSRSADTGPTPQSDRTGIGSRNASSSSGATTTTPAGLAAAEASFATSLDRPIPTDTGTPASSTARSRRSRATPGQPSGPGRTAPRSANASSMLSGSTASDRSRSAAMIRSEYAVYASNRGTTTVACGHARRALAIDMADRTPIARAS